MRNRLWTTIVGAVAAIAIGVTCTSAAFPAFAAQGIAGAVTDTGTQSSSSVKTNGQPDSTDQGDSSITDDSTVSGSNADSQSDAGSASTAPKAEAEGQDSCDNVLTWTKLSECVSDKTSQTVTIAGKIEVPATAGKDIPIITQDITLTAKSGVNPALTSQTNGDAIFNVAPGASLTIGTDKDDANFSYKDGKRFLVFLQGPNKSQNGGKLTVNNGTFSGIDTTGSTNHDMGTLAYSAGGTVTINNGTFANNTASRGGVVYSQGGSLTVNGGEFKDNTAKGGAEGGVFYQSSAKVIVNGGAFAGNTAINGGVMYQTSDNASLAISGGTFEDNESKDAGNKGGGGVLFQMQGKTDITGGSFIGNRQTYTEQCTDPSSLGPTSDLGACRKGNSGGGVIHTEGGTLTIAGNVTFSGNYSKAYGWGDGGGVIFAKGTLWLRNDAKGNKPQFKDNWSGIYDTQYVDGKVPAGGAGGAIFLHSGTAYFMGGNFEGNTSGYLGGAVYTEEGTTSWIGKTAAKENIAGHFGGGLWLCPSGEGDASKGGNIALFDNSVDKSIDPNVQNMSPYIGTMKAGFTQTTVTYTRNDVDGVEAGADLAIMNPFWKDYGDRTFVLMDTWFTDRTESAVDWYEDGTPVRAASGFIDRYQSPRWTSDKTPEGTNLAVTKTNGRYLTNPNKVRIDLVGDDDGDNHVYTLRLSKDLNAAAPTYTTGLALTSVVKGDKAQQEKLKAAAWNGAAVTFSGNKARLSGGAFGTDGNVKFSTPYTASWTKIDSKDTSKELSDSQWDLSATTSSSSSSGFTGTGTTEGEAIKSAIKQFNEKNENTPVAGPFNVDFSPTLCPVTTDSTDKNKKLYEEGYADGHCWKQTFDESYKATEESNVWKVTFTSITLSAVITDNSSKDKGGTTYTGAFDNNPDGGGFDLNNLAPGTYTLKERTAPTGYELNTNTYQFKIVNGPAKWQGLDKDGKPIGDFTQTDTAIPDKALPGVSWSKTDADTGALLPNSEWTVTKYQKDGEILETKSRWIVQDCVHLTDKDIDCSTQAKNSGEYLGDHDNAAGKFNITGLQPGKYRLTESVAPEGYWDPQEDVYEFTIKDADTSVQLTKVGGGTTDETVTAITNKLPQISWKKVDKTSLDIITDSETKTEWTVTGPVAVLVDGDASTDTPELDLQSETVSVTDCQSKDDADASVRCSTQKTGKQEDKSGNWYYYNDLDNAAGQLKISGLQRPTAEQAAKNIRYQYVLKETKAPEGYMKSDKEYVFTIGATEPQSNLELDNTECSTTVGGTNCIPNTKAIASLPFTGGRSGLDWLLLGGGIALAAALAALATGRVKRHEL